MSSLAVLLQELDDEAMDERIFKDCCVVNKFPFDSITPDEGDSLKQKKIKDSHRIWFNRKLTVNCLGQTTIHYH